MGDKIKVLTKLNRKRHKEIQNIAWDSYLLGENMLKKIFLFEATFPDIANLAYLLLGFTFAVLVGAILARRLSKHFLNIR